MVGVLSEINENFETCIRLLHVGVYLATNGFKKVLFKAFGAKHRKYFAMVCRQNVTFMKHKHEDQLKIVRDSFNKRQVRFKQGTCG